MKMPHFLLVLLTLILLSCSSDTTSNRTEQAEINIRLDRDPQKINPFFAPSARGREVFQYIFLAVADYHPKTLELSPILITKIPEGRIEQVGEEQHIAYDLEFRPEAKWSDGQPITGLDYIFTIKAVNHPDSKASAWKPYFQALKGFKLQDDPRKVTVYFDANYMLSREIALTPPLMPAHLYDPNEIITKKDLVDLMDANYSPTDTIETNIMETINSSATAKENVVQSGPYELASFETNQYIQLVRKENYWGDKVKGIPYLKNNIGKITFKIVPDEVAAVTMAKEGKLDLMKMRSSNSFQDLREETNFADDWTFHTPQLWAYYYMALNNKSPILQDAKVRRAFAHLADIEDYIETLDGGMGMRTTGHFHPVRSYYNKDLPLIEYNEELAGSLLTDAGWVDNDGDGVREKVIDGKTTDLEVDILQTGSSLGKNISLLYQASAEKAGVKINIITKKIGLMTKENLYDYNYDIALLRVGMDEAPDDPYSRWHSDNAVAGGSNTLGYENTEVDRLIEQLRNSRSKADRKLIYYKIQEVMYEDTPCVFLYCPLEKLMVSDKYKALSSTKRPGYMANTFE